METIPSKFGRSKQQLGKNFSNSFDLLGQHIQKSSPGWNASIYHMARRKTGRESKFEEWEKKAVAENSRKVL